MHYHNINSDVRLVIFFITITAINPHPVTLWELIKSQYDMFVY